MSRNRVGRGRGCWAAAAALVVAGAGVAACSGGDGGDSAEGEESRSPTTAAEAPETTSTTLSPTQEVEEAFLAFDAMTHRLRESPDPEDPEIAQRASGETLAGITDATTTLQTTGFTMRFGERDSVQILSVTLVDPATAVVHECTVEDLTEVNAAGETNGPFIRTFWTEWTLVKAGDAWLVDSSDGIERREGEHPCE